MGFLEKNFKMDREQQAKESESLFAPLKWAARRKTFPLICTAFGWGFLMTGLVTGGSYVGMSVSEAFTAMIIGNIILTIVAVLVSIPGQATGSGNSSLFIMSYGQFGFVIPALLFSMVLTSWHGLVSGMLAETWLGVNSGPAYVIMALIWGVVAMMLTYGGMKFMEIIAIPATFALIAIGIFSIFYAINLAGGWDVFVAAMNEASASAKSEGINTSVMAGVTLVVGSWIAGAGCASEVTRFTKTRSMAIVMIVIGIPLCQFFLNILGYIGQNGAGSYNFCVYLANIGPVIHIISLLAMTLALLSSLDVNLYLPSCMISNIFRIPRKGGVLILGTIGTIMGGCGAFNYFGNFMNVMASILPGLVGPLIADFYILNRGKWDIKLLHKVPKFNICAILAYVFGFISQFTFAPPGIPKELWAILMSLIMYIVLMFIFKAAGHPQGYWKVKHLAEGPYKPQQDDSQLGDYFANFINYDGKVTHLKEEHDS